MRAREEGFSRRANHETRTVNAGAAPVRSPASPAPISRNEDTRQRRYKRMPKKPRAAVVPSSRARIRPPRARKGSRTGRAKTRLAAVMEKGPRLVESAFPAVVAVPARANPAIR
ncbi:MAG: hypothetical protein A2Y36_09625 [Treponema sp. GWA1_62_8]|nr:MAG: hypothetical protein A2Y36_09625 [Treponema sp. GWA1_62_8]